MVFAYTMSHSGRIAGLTAGVIISSMQSRSPQTSPSGLSRYVPSTSELSSPIQVVRRRRRQTNARRRRRNPAYFKSSYGRQFLKKPTMYNLPK